MIRRYVATQIYVLIVVVLAVLRSWTVALVMYVVRRVFVSIKVSVLRTVLGNSVTTTMTVLWESNAVVMESVLAHGSVSNSVNQILNVILGSIVARRKVCGFGKIVVMKPALVRIVYQMMNVDLLMNAVLLENVQKMVANGEKPNKTTKIHPHDGTLLLCI
jgi:hypothetical protein